MTPFVATDRERCPSVSNMYCINHPSLPEVTGWSTPLGGFFSQGLVGWRRVDLSISWISGEAAIFYVTRDVITGPLTNPWRHGRSCLAVQCRCCCTAAQKQHRDSPCQPAGCVLCCSPKTVLSITSNAEIVASETSSFIQRRNYLVIAENAVAQNAKIMVPSRNETQQKILHEAMSHLKEEKAIFYEELNWKKQKLISFSLLSFWWLMLAVTILGQFRWLVSSSAIVTHHFSIKSS